MALTGGQTSALDLELAERGLGSGAKQRSSSKKTGDGPAASTCHRSAPKRAWSCRSGSPAWSPASKPRVASCDADGCSAGSERVH